ncbi:Uncharacterised protein [Mycobacteroides abscessus subsp. abscessus]|nr:Uncharacterised protein [Mycobacteroides abscessus subsp. abscessus]
MSWKPKVYVDHDPGDTVVYVEKPSGGYVVVAVGSIYRASGGFAVLDDVKQQSTFAEKVFG